MWKKNDVMLEKTNTSILVWKWLLSIQVFSPSSSSTPLPRSRPAAAQCRTFLCFSVCMRACVQWVLARVQRLTSGINSPFRLRGAFLFQRRPSGRVRRKAKLWRGWTLLFSWIGQVIVTPPGRWTVWSDKISWNRMRQTCCSSCRKQRSPQNAHLIVSNTTG